MTSPSAKPLPAPSTSGLWRTRWRVFAWSLMLAAIAWTLVYQRAQRASAVPEFVYANF